MQGCGTRHGAWYFCFRWSFHDSIELLFPTACSTKKLCCVSMDNHTCSQPSTILLTYLLLCRYESVVSEGSMEAVPFKVRSASQVVGWSDMRFNQIEFPNQLSAQEISATASFFFP